MPKIPRLLLLASLFVLTVRTPLHAQAQAQPGDANPAAAPAPEPEGHAPEEMTRKLTDLVDAGKYTEAEKLTEGLLIAYPDDQRLIKAKALIGNALAQGGPTGAAPGSRQPAQPAADANAEQLTGMDKVDYDALIELGRQALQDADLGQQEASLRQFMDQSSVFLQKHPDHMLLWELRAQSALSLNEPMAGFEAGQRLLAAGVTDSTDANVRRLLAQLRNKDWLNKQEAESQAAVARTNWVLGTWSVSWSHIDESGHLLKTGNEYIDFSRIDSKLEGCIFHGAKPTHFTYCSVRIEVLDTGKLQCENLNAESAWQPLSCETGDQNRTMKVEYLPSKEGDRYSWLMHKE